MYYKASTKYFPVLLCTTKLAKKHFPALLCTTKLAQSASQHYFVLQSLHKALASTTLYYKACTKHVPVLLCTTKLAQSTSQYRFVLQSLHKALPSTTLYYTKLAQSTSLYDFVLQSLHKALPSTTLYYKACTKHVPVPLHCTRKNTRIHAPASSPTHAPCNIHAAITMRCASTHCRTPKGGTDYARNDRSRTRRAHKLPLLQPLYTAKRFLPNTSPMQHSCSHYNAFCSTLHTSMRCRTPRKNRLLETIPAAPAAHTSCLSSPAAATLHGKTQGFMPRLPPQRSITSLSHQPSSSPLPLVTTTTSLSHHFSWAPLPLVTTLRHHHFP